MSRVPLDSKASLARQINEAAEKASGTRLCSQCRIHRPIDDPDSYYKRIRHPNGAMNSRWVCGACRRQHLMKGPR